MLSALWNNKHGRTGNQFFVIVASAHVNGSGEMWVEKPLPSSSGKEPKPSYLNKITGDRSG